MPSYLIPRAILKLLLLCSVPSGYDLEIACDAGELVAYVVHAVWAYGVSTQRA